MGEFDIDAVVVETIRRHTGTGGGDVGREARLAEDLRLSENGRRSLFAFLVEAFSARGLNLPSRGFFLSNFLALATVGDVQDGIRDALGGAKKKSAPAARPEPPTPAPAPVDAAPPEVEAPQKKRAPAKKTVSTTRAKPKGKPPAKSASAKRRSPARKGPRRG